MEATIVSGFRACLCIARAHLLADIGNGTYEPVYGQPGVAPAQAPVNYGATGGNYVR